MLRGYHMEIGVAEIYYNNTGIETIIPNDTYIYT